MKLMHCPYSPAVGEAKVLYQGDGTTEFWQPTLTDQIAQTSRAFLFVATWTWTILQMVIVFFFLDRLDAKVVHLLYANVCVRGGSEAKVLDRYLSDGTRESLAAYCD